MGEIDAAIADIERLAREFVPRCFEVRGVGLVSMDPGLPSPTPFAIVVRVARCSDEPEPGGWVYDLAKRVRERWQREDFALSVREEISDE